MEKVFLPQKFYYFREVFVIYEKFKVGQGLWMGIFLMFAGSVVLIIAVICVN